MKWIFGRTNLHRAHARIGHEERKRVKRQWLSMPIDKLPQKSHAKFHNFCFLSTNERVKINEKNLLFSTSENREWCQWSLLHAPLPYLIWMTIDACLHPNPTKLCDLRFALIILASSSTSVRLSSAQILGAWEGFLRKHNIWLHNDWKHLCFRTSFIDQTTQ